MSWVIPPPIAYSEEFFAQFMLCIQLVTFWTPRSVFSSSVAEKRRKGASPITFSREAR